VMRACGLARRRRRDERPGCARIHRRPVQENSYIVRAGGSAERAGDRRPGDEPERLLAAAEALGVEIEAILITHCHFDHIGAVAPVALATGAPVYCPVIERGVLADVMQWVPPGFGPFESYEADHTVAGGERLSLAGLDIEVIFTPGHSPDTSPTRSRRQQPVTGRAQRPGGRSRSRKAGKGAVVGRRAVPGVRRPCGSARW